LLYAGLLKKIRKRKSPSVATRWGNYPAAGDIALVEQQRLGFFDLQHQSFHGMWSRWEEDKGLGDEILGYLGNCLIGRIHMIYA
jgi:hypothetical protein